MLNSSLPNQHKYQLGLIGNCNFSALIATDGNVKWMCWPRFDSSFIFGSLLDEQKGGEFSIRPSADKYTSTQRYVDNTNILVTKFEAADGVFELIDFAPRFMQYERYHKPLMLMRKVRKVSGHPRIKVVCKPAGYYGTVTGTSSLGSNHIRYGGLEEPVRLTTNASLTMITQERDFSLSEEELYFVLAWGIPLEVPLKTTFEDFYSRTEKYWQNWVRQCALPKAFQKEVIRSALCLKLHQFEDTGGIVASFTTSLPEIPGEGRNWDYRFCWLRDTYYTISALNSLGHFDEAEKYAHFIENLNIGSLSTLQPVYRIDGDAEMFERDLPLDGYLGNQPVRIGNGAASQIQHDAYGQIMLALYSLYTDARILGHDRQSTHTLEHILGHIERTMHDPDNGVWEFRGFKQLHSYSLLFHWAGSAAAKKVGLIYKDEKLVARADKCMKQASVLLEKCYNPGLKAYTQSMDSNHLDASMLQMITQGYFWDKPRELAVHHLRAIQKELEISPGFLLRYKHKDDFGTQRSAFLVCSFWYIEALLHLDFIEEAQECMKRVLEAQNHLGLMAEDFDTTTLSQWGNFPQSYSHVGLINCAFALDKALHKPPFLP
jgi:GH15 family glucan-1,4-alpha-glucosidase